MPKICDFRSADRCGFLEHNLAPCPTCPFRAEVASPEDIPAGPQGERGDPGPTGAAGPTGPRGDSGPQGNTGRIGPIGAHGLLGLAGLQGPRGLPGPKGDKGDEGAEGTVDEELLRRLIKLQLERTQPNPVILGWGGRRGIPLLVLVTKTSNYTIGGGDSVILCNAAAGAFTVTLPTAAGRKGKVYHTKKIDSSGNAVTVDGDTSETIDGDTTKVIVTQYDSMMVVSDGSNWHIV